MPLCLQQSLFRLERWGPMSGRINFSRIADAALSEGEAIVMRWLPGGRREGQEWVVRNPRRKDRSPGSFKINIRTGKWSDFATGESGGDFVSLAAFLFDLSQREAALGVAHMTGVDPYET